MVMRLVGFTLETKSIPVFLLGASAVGDSLCETVLSDTECCTDDETTSSSDGGGGAGSAEHACCPGVMLSNLLYLSFSSQGAGGDCDCAIGEDLELVYNPDNDQWEWDGTLCEVAVSFNFYCLGNGVPIEDSSWGLDVLGPTGSSGNTAFPTTCEPFLWEDSYGALSGIGICDLSMSGDPPRARISSLPS